MVNSMSMISESSDETNTIHENELDDFNTEENHSADPYSWFKIEKIEKYRGPKKWYDIHRATVYGILSCIFGFLVVYNKLQGTAFVLFMLFLSATIITILIDQRNRFKWRKSKR